MIILFTTWVTTACSITHFGIIHIGMIHTVDGIHGALSSLSVLAGAGAGMRGSVIRAGDSGATLTMVQAGVAVIGVAGATGVAKVTTAVMDTDRIMVPVQALYLQVARFTLLATGSGVLTR